MIFPRMPKVPFVALEAVLKKAQGHMRDPTHKHVSHDAGQDQDGKTRASVYDSCEQDIRGPYPFHINAVPDHRVFIDLNHFISPVIFFSFLQDPVRLMFMHMMKAKSTSPMVNNTCLCSPAAYPISDTMAVVRTARS